MFWSERNAIVGEKKERNPDTMCRSEERKVKEENNESKKEGAETE